MKFAQPIQISIPNPCHEDWDKMTPKEQGRFCSSCQKCVVDFTGFSDGQLYKFLAERRGQKICGRFNRTQLNRQISIPHQPHSALYKWMIAAGLALVFTVTPDFKSFAQVPQVSEQVPRTFEKIRGVSSIEGIVLGEDNKPIRGASIKLYQAKEFDNALSDIDGLYFIRMVPYGKYDIVEKEGYRKKIIQGVLLANRSSLSVNVKLTKSKKKSEQPEVCEYIIPVKYDVDTVNTTIITGDILMGPFPLVDPINHQLIR